MTIARLSPIPLRLPSGYSSLLPLVYSASNLLITHGPYTDPKLTHRVATRTLQLVTKSLMEETVVPFFISEPTSHSRPAGFLRPNVLSVLQDTNATRERTGLGSPLRLFYPADRHAPDSPWAMSFAPWVNKGGFALRTAQIKELVLTLKNQNLFPSILGNWNDEQYPVYHPDRESTVDTGVAFAIERAALPLFGFANYGCLLTAYFQSPHTGETMVWIPRRSRSKKTWPGYLDVTVGGGIALGDTALSTIIRESAEEASLDPSFVAQSIRPAGVLSFPNRSPAGWILPGLYYLFDLDLQTRLQDGTIPPNSTPQVNQADGEVEGFQVMSVREVLVNLLGGKFKPSSALALVDFLVRHGHVTEVSDPMFVDVCLALRRDLMLPVPWKF